MDDDNKIYMWTIYDHPLDYPDDYVARKFEITWEGARPTSEIIVNKSLNLIRIQMLAMNLSQMARMLEDEPQILEIWL